ncbi:hypothetical protein FGG08_003997 [Glutinoglossum americanum]|uniref:Uncharacterized protein n=1 Tax=Glutinoglossum americanum TaxID=1670608 RepID=A0A9P8KXI6_9PEZI|nr:hypothetical protein FGG08_003997 [Glutinoglossum americanum]
MAPRSHSRSLVKELFSTLNEATYDVDSPSKIRERDNFIKATAPYTGKTYFDTMDTNTEPTEPTSHYIYPTLLDEPLTVKMIDSSVEIRPYQLEIPIEGDKNRFRVEFEDGQSWIVRLPEPDSAAGQRLLKISNQIKDIFQIWTRECFQKELKSLKWEVFSKEQMELTDRDYVTAWEKDLFARQAQEEIRHKLMNDYTFFVQKQVSFGTPSYCSYIFCASPEKRTPPAGYRLSLEPRDNIRLRKVPGAPVIQNKRGHGIKGAQWFCLTCVEAIWNGVDLLTAETLATMPMNDKIQKAIPQLPKQPAPLAPFMSLSQGLYSFMEAEVRDHVRDHFALPLPQHAALLKWKTTLNRRIENEVESNIESRKQNGILFDNQDPDNDVTHDEKYWVRVGDSYDHTQLRGCVDPMGMILELTTAECRNKELSEVFQIVDAKVQEEWDKIRHIPQPHLKKIVVLMFDYYKYYPHLREKVARFRAKFPRDPEIDMDGSNCSGSEDGF